MDNTNQTNDIIIMDFSRIYEKENFFEHEKIKWIDCTDIIGINCYCDEEAERNIKKRIQNYSPSAIHFIDSGNYHYVTEFWMEKIQTDFALVVFDHHSDMQKPIFDDILSCGSWILKAIEKNEYLKKIILVGLSREQEALISPKYINKIQCINSESLKENNNFNKILNQLGDLPIYISIDKDVLSKNVVETTWDQGDMTLGDLKEILHFLINNHQIIGIDICGECRNDITKISAISKDNNINANLLEFLKEEKPL